MAGYCTIRDLRDEGVTVEQASDARLRVLIQEASEAIERVTGWFFEPRSLVLRLDGRGAPSLEPTFPPISLSRVTVGFETLSLEPEETIIVGAPVSREFVAPRITRRCGVFARGYGNVVAIGTWGYTEPNGTRNGRTPLAIRRACMMLVVRLLPRIADTEAVEDARDRWRVVAEATRDQSIRFALPTRVRELTGDPDVDEILVRYQRPMGIGAA